MPRLVIEWEFQDEPLAVTQQRLLTIARQWDERAVVRCATGKHIDFYITKEKNDDEQR